MSMLYRRRPENSSGLVVAGLVILALVIVFLAFLVTQNTASCCCGVPTQPCENPQRTALGYDAPINYIPEPSTLLLFGAGLVALAWSRWPSPYPSRQTRKESRDDDSN